MGEILTIQQDEYYVQTNIISVPISLLTPVKLNVRLLLQNRSGPLLPRFRAKLTIVVKTMICDVRNFV